MSRESSIYVCIHVYSLVCVSVFATKHIFCFYTRLKNEQLISLKLGLNLGQLSKISAQISANQQNHPNPTVAAHSRSA